MSLQQMYLNEFRKIKSKLNSLQEQVNFFQAEYEKAQRKNESVLLRMKNREVIPNHFINGPLAYLDMSPEEAYDYYSDENKDFLIIDVSDNKDEETGLMIPEAQPLSLDEITIDLTIYNRPILVISTHGVQSIHACNKLCELGFIHVNNISGGLKFWPGFRQSHLQAV